MSRATPHATLVLLALAAASSAAAGAAAGAPSGGVWGEVRAEELPAAVVPDRPLVFPADRGSHPRFRIEWWYATGWIHEAGGAPLGFQITFFRTHPQRRADNPSAFAPRELLIAHAAVSDPAHGRLWLDQRIARAGFGLAQAEAGDTRVWIDAWRLERRGEDYLARIEAREFTLELTLRVTQPPLLNGTDGYSRKGSAAGAASYYYSEPHLAVTGSWSHGERRAALSGEAWLDHEWSSEYLETGAVGWDWVGINLEDGAALMAFRIRDRAGRARFAGGTLRRRDGSVRIFAPEEIVFTPRRLWRSPRTGIVYPVGVSLHAGDLELVFEPLMLDQESDARRSTGAIYWEGAVRAWSATRLAGRGYLELTGYGEPLRLD